MIKPEKDTDEIYEAIKQANKGDTLAYEPYDIAYSIAETTTHDIRDVRIDGRRNIEGSQHLILWLPNSEMNRFVVGEYGHNDRKEDRGFRVKQTGSKILAGYTGGFDTDVFDDIDMSEDDKTDLKNQIAYELVDSSDVVEDMIIDSIVMNFDIGESYVLFDCKEPIHMFAGHEETKELIQELRNKYIVEGREFKRLIKKAIKNDKLCMFKYNIKLDQGKTYVVRQLQYYMQQ